MAKKNRGLRDYMIPCFGRSQRTGKQVGRRHRWNGGQTCEWCHRDKDAMRPEKSKKGRK